MTARRRDASRQTRRPGTPPPAPTPTRYLFWRPFLALLVLGLIGVAALYPAMTPIAQDIAARPDMTGVSVAKLKLLLLLNPTLLLVVLVAVGTLVAPRVGLRSHVAAWAARTTDARGRRLSAEVGIAVAVGFAAAVLLLVLDEVSRPLLGPGAETLSTIASQRRTVADTVSAMLYGGITEELMMRWGVLALLAWAAWQVLQRGRPAPGPGIFWGAVVAAAVVFGAGHLGVVAAQVPLTTTVVVRTIGLNAVAGIAYGWLCWRRSLEAAMIAHAAGHVVFAAVSWLGVL